MKDISFREKINGFISFSGNSNDNNSIKIEYLKLVKEFHPNITSNPDKETANEYMIMVNNPSYDGNKEETGYKIIEHLYKAYNKRIENK